MFRAMASRDDVRSDREIPPRQPNASWGIRCSWRASDGRMESHRVSVTGDPDRFFDNHCYNGHPDGTEILCELLGRAHEGQWVINRTWWSE